MTEPRGRSSGAGSPRVGSHNVTMLGRVPHERIPELYAEADAAVVLLRDKPLFEGALPTKMFEAMSAGRPLVLSAAGEAASLVEEASCGVVVPPSGRASWPPRSATWRATASAPADSGPPAVEAMLEGYSREQAFDRWYGLLTSLVG